MFCAVLPQTARHDFGYVFGRPVLPEVTPIIAICSPGTRMFSAVLPEPFNAATTIASSHR